MPSRQVFNSVLHNFLGTYTSRYSDYEGYWLFGFLVDHLELFEVDLLAGTSGETGRAANAATELATQRFADQVSKSGCNFRLLCDARLKLERLPGVCRGPVNGRISNGYSVRFQAMAKVDTGRVFVSERIVFIAPHNPFSESRSTRAY